VGVKDGFVSITAITPQQWKGLVWAMGNPEWARDARFSNLPNRLEKQALLDQHVSAWTRERSDYEATETLRHGVFAAFPSLSARELFEDPHFNARGTWVEVDHAYGKETVYGIPWKLSSTPGQVKANHPLGSDTR